VIENKIAFLRGCTALRFIGKKAITKEVLLMAIQQANDEIHAKFSRGMREVRPYTSRIPSKLDMDYAGVRVVCEDTRLSLRAAGVVYLGLDLKDKLKEIGDMPMDELDELLDNAAAGLSVEAVVPNGPSERRIQWDIQQSPGFQRTRVLMAQLCG
jgi:hypothetical protein